jgi:hypothetical protein
MWHQHLIMCQISPTCAFQFFTVKWAYTLFKCPLQTQSRLSISTYHSAWHHHVEMLFLIQSRSWFDWIRLFKFDLNRLLFFHTCMQLTCGHSSAFEWNAIDDGGPIAPTYEEYYDISNFYFLALLVWFMLCYFRIFVMFFHSRIVAQISKSVGKLFRVYWVLFKWLFGRESVIE